MRDDIRNYLRRASAAKPRPDTFFDDVPDVEEDLGEVILDAQIDAAEHLNPAQAATSLLIVRLTGHGITDGWIDQSMQEAILGPFTQEVQHAASSETQVQAHVRLGLVGVGSGSVLLQYRPRIPEIAANDEQLAFAVHPADSAVLRVSELHDLLEQEAPAPAIASAFKNENKLLAQTRKLVEALEKYDVNLSTRWWGPTSTRRRSALTQRGRAHGLRVFTAMERDDEVSIHGMVTNADIDGTLIVTSTANHKHKVNVGYDRVSDPEFALGRQVHIWALRVQEVDGVGVSQKRDRYTFLHHINRPTIFPA